VIAIAGVCLDFRIDCFGYAEPPGASPWLGAFGAQNAPPERFAGKPSRPPALR